jgi:hypothetical protein
MEYQTLSFKYMNDPKYEDFIVMVLETARLDDSDTSILLPSQFGTIHTSTSASLGLTTRLNLVRIPNACTDISHTVAYAPEAAAAVNESGGSSRKDANFAHMKAFREVGAAGRRKFFDPLYGYDQTHLQILGTHPDYHRRGSGAAV